MTEAGMEVSVEEAYNVAFARLCGLEKGLLSLTDEAREQAFDVGLATSLAACRRGMTEDQAADAVFLGLEAAVGELEWPQEVVAMVQEFLASRVTKVAAG